MYEYTGLNELFLNTAYLYIHTFVRIVLYRVHHVKTFTVFISYTCDDFAVFTSTVPMYVCTNLHSLVYIVVKSSSHERERGVLTNIYIQYMSILLYCSMYNVRYRFANVCIGAYDV
jgi:hypothetical protein